MVANKKTEHSQLDAQSLCKSVSDHIIMYNQKLHSPSVAALRLHTQNAFTPTRSIKQH